MTSLKKRILDDEAIDKIDLLDEVLFNFLGRDSLTSKELSYYEKNLRIELQRYTCDILKNYEKLIRINKPEFQREFDLELERIGHTLITEKLMAYRDCAVETGAALCMIILKTLNAPLE